MSKRTSLSALSPGRLCEFRRTLLGIGGTYGLLPAKKVNGGIVSTVFTNNGPWVSLSKKDVCMYLGCFNYAGPINPPGYQIDFASNSTCDPRIGTSAVLLLHQDKLACVSMDFFERNFKAL